jgi:hypothetical protein
MKPVAANKISKRNKRFLKMNWPRDCHIHISFYLNAEIYMKAQRNGIMLVSGHWLLVVLPVDLKNQSPATSN